MKFGPTKTEEEELEEYSAEGMRNRLAAAYTAWRDEVAAKLEPVVYPNHAWVVYAGTETQQPQAAFTNREYADILAGHMVGVIDPVLRERSEIKAMNIEVDKYKEQVSFGKMPYEIILNAKGEVYDSWGPNDGIPAIKEPVPLTDKWPALSGTFWGWTGGEAIENAQKMFQELKGKAQL
ncbi:MAG: hypothetical protein J7619_23170 [Dyadobacter sp.]|uniref:hypothetical protein n=1 Tax=Dyadobacter sp. TaxID=1914288 RepID=UPI001B05D3A2|nr:hypothetical protein [Dyadobacter sp.]MBO9615617.1 hypothetical protein [Dyadobacter sp.]